MKNFQNKHEELHDWIDALENLILFNGKDDAADLIKDFIQYAKNRDLLDDENLIFPFENTISKDLEEDFPGDLEIEKTIRHYIRWNALVTVLKANKENDLGGHISTYSLHLCFMKQVSIISLRGMKTLI